MTNFKIGDTVICINNKPKNSNLKAPPLRLNCEYTILDIRNSPCGSSIDVGFGSSGGTRCRCRNIEHFERDGIH